MKNRKEIQKYFQNKYYNKNENYKAILSEIREDKIMNRNKILKAISTAVLTLLGATTIAFASTQIYNNYIKEKNSVDTVKTFGVGESYIDDESVISLEDMFLNPNDILHHKIITNINDYNRYKKRINELPEMTESSFDENFLVVVANTMFRQPHERDLELYDVTADETTTHIIMKQKENPDYNKKGNIWYAVVDKTLLRENVETKIEHKYIENPNFVKLSELPDDYSTEDAIKDGCFVQDKEDVLSDNKYAIDEFLEKAKKEGNAFIRLYKKFEEDVTIIDLEYKNGFFTSNGKNLGDKTIGVSSYPYMTKEDFSKNQSVYVFNEADENGNQETFMDFVVTIINQ